jgi:hypothetical protein
MNIASWCVFLSLVQPKALDAESRRVQNNACRGSVWRTDHRRGSGGVAVTWSDEAAWRWRRGGQCGCLMSWNVDELLTAHRDDKSLLHASFHRISKRSHFHGSRGKLRSRSSNLVNSSCFSFKTKVLPDVRNVIRLRFTQCFRCDLVCFLRS